MRSRYSAAVSITLPKGCGTPKAAALSADGMVTQLDLKVKDNTVAFTIEEVGYYTVAAVPSDDPGADAPVSP